jgi:hypothetical protein
MSATTATRHAYSLDLRISVRSRWQIAPSLFPHRAAASRSGCSSKAGRSPSLIRAPWRNSAYLRSGGGDGTEGGGGENPPLLLPTERRDLPPSAAVEEEPTDGQSLRPKLLSTIRMFREIGSELSPGEAEKFVFWPSLVHLPHSRAGAAAWADAASMLGSAAWMLVREMLLRLPDPHDMAASVQWQRDARRLGHTLARLELWPLLLNKPYWWPLEKMLDTLKKMWPHLDKKDDLFPTLQLVDDLFIEGAALLRVDKDAKFYRPLPIGPNRIDPIADLLRFPLPAEFAKVVGKSGIADRSLYHALAAFTASPQAVLGVDERAIDLMLFASACIVGPASAMPACDLWSSSPHSYLPAVQRAAIEQLHADAWSWLSEQLPAAVFGTVVEDAIAQAGELRYASASGTPG